MSRGPRDFKERVDPREKAEAERRRTLERFRQHQAAVDQERNARETALAAKRNRFSALNIGEALAAARRLSTWRRKARAMPYR